MSSTSFLARLLTGVPPGKWVAIRHDRAEVIGHADDSAAAEALAHEAGDADPIVMKVPAAADSLLARRRAVTREPLYEVIAMAIAEGGVVPFLGAGASLVGRPPGALFDARRAPFMPSTYELTEFVGEKSHYPKGDLPDSDLARVSSFMVLQGGPHALNAVLKSALGPIEAGRKSRCEPGALHHFLAREQRIRLVLTTNYDSLVEDAYQAAERDYDLLIYPSPKIDRRGSVMRVQCRFVDKVASETVDHLDPRTLGLSLETSVIFKMHGSLKSNSYVITEEDYLDFLKLMGSAVPPTLLDYIRSQSLLFLGYGLKDWNLRLLLHNLEPLNTGWAVQREATEAESVLWNRRNISIFQSDIDDFVRGLQPYLDPPAPPAQTLPAGPPPEGRP